MGKKRKKRKNASGAASTAPLRRMPWETRVSIPHGKETLPIFMTVAVTAFFVFLCLTMIGFLNVDTNIFLRFKEFEIGIQAKPHSNNPLIVPQDEGGPNAAKK